MYPSPRYHKIFQGPSTLSAAPGRLRATKITRCSVIMSPVRARTRPSEGFVSGISIWIDTKDRMCVASPGANSHSASPTQEGFFVTSERCTGCIYPLNSDYTVHFPIVTEVPARGSLEERILRNTSGGGTWRKSQYGKHIERRTHRRLYQQQSSIDQALLLRLQP